MDYDYLKYKKILIVDDEADLREMVTSILAQDGFKTIRTAGTVAEALKICRDWEPDLAILDVMLPDGDGLSLFEQMRTFTEVPVLFLTARGEDEDKLKGFTHLDKGGQNAHPKSPFFQKKFQKNFFTLENCPKNAKKAACFSVEKQAAWLFFI